ncbi:hypothetical protein AB0M44_43175, partial [Streptosporangium subroseum]|uniref:hypothetical protein n=1 Tax=Streptosporangium subroseum TaxID=106412 RepID=UPI0034378544
MGLSPAEQDVLVGQADHERGQQRLGHAAVCESVLGVAEIDVVALDPAVDAFGWLWRLQLAPFSGLSWTHLTIFDGLVRRLDLAP